MSVVKMLDGKRYTIWSRHKTKSKANESAKKMRENRYLARVIKNTNKSKTKREWSHPWEVYVYKKPRKGPLFTLRRRKK